MYLIFFLFFQNNSNAADNTNDADDSIENDEDMEEDEQDEVKEKTNLPAGLVRWREGIEKVQILNYLNWNLEFQANLTKNPSLKLWQNKKCQGDDWPNDVFLLKRLRESLN